MVTDKNKALLSEHTTWYQPIMLERVLLPFGLKTCTFCHPCIFLCLCLFWDIFPNIINHIGSNKSKSSDSVKSPCQDIQLPWKQKTFFKIKSGQKRKNVSCEYRMNYSRGEMILKDKEQIAPRTRVPSLCQWTIPMGERKRDTLGVSC